MANTTDKVKKLETIKLDDGEYAKVATRLKAFREDCPRGVIETKPEIKGSTVLFKAHIVADKSSPNSAEATGHSIGSTSEDKVFEKVETIAVGRALAMLGYLASGEIASSEEMERFRGRLEFLEKAREEIEKITTIAELKDFYAQNKGKGKELDLYVSLKAKQLTNKQ